MPDSTDKTSQVPAERRRPGDPEGETQRGSSPAATPLPGDERQEMQRTPGDGSLAGATPAGLSAEELRRRAEEPGQTNDAGTS